MVFVTEVEISGMASGLDAHTSPLHDHSASINHVGLGGPHDLDVQLLRPPGDDLPRAVRFVLKRSSYPIVPYTSVYGRSIRATSITPWITRCPGAYTSTESSPRLRLGNTID
jgi:hypothetical protein